MDGTPRSFRARPRPAATADSAPRCSCDLLLQLAQRSPCREILADQGVEPPALATGQISLHEALAAEPADWHRRLAERGASASDLEQLLAIVRSAESHGYQLLEQLGVRCAALRRRIVAHRRAEGSPQAREDRPRRTPRSAAAGEPVRSNRAWRGRRARAARIASIEDEADAGVEPSACSSDAVRRRASVEPSSSSPDAARRRASVEPSSSSPDAVRRRAAARPSVTASDDQTRPAWARPSSPSSPRPTPDVDPSEAVPSDADTLDAAALEAAALDTAAPNAAAPNTAAPNTAAPNTAASNTAAPSTAAPNAAAPAAAPKPRPTILRPIDPDALPPLVGHETLLAQLADALLRCASRPPVLVGPSGGGRSLVARHLARVIDAPVFMLDATQYDDEEALGRQLEAVARARGIAVLDDLDRVPSDAVPPFFAALARAWSRRHPPVLTLASPESHARLDLWLPGGAGLFDRIALPPLPSDRIAEAVAAAAPAVLGAHRVSLAADASLDELTRLADRYLGELAMPGRALDLLDLSCARAARQGEARVTRDTWLDVVSERSGLPRARIEAQGDARLLELEQCLATQVVGHTHVTATLARLVRRNRAGFGSQRPVLSTLLLGPSGVGKTEIAKALGQALYERPDALVRLDMSEYAEPHAVARVVGAPPGYVGHEQGGALTDPLRRRPHCVVLLDELEKAHREVHLLLLQVLDEGRITDGRGRVVDLHHAVVVMTSNLGADQIDAEGHLDEGAVLDVARRAFPVELWNRIEAPLVLQPLGPESMMEICRRLARSSSERLFAERGIRYVLADEACEHLVALAGRDPALGARPLRHLLTREVESVIAEAVLRGRLRAGTQTEVGLRGDRLVLR